MSKTKLLNEVIASSTTMNCMCSALAKNISPKYRENCHSQHSSGKITSAHSKRK